MKKLLALSFCGIILTGCGGGIPSECETTLKEYDDLIAQIEKQGQLPEQVKTQVKDARNQLETSIKKVSKDDAIKVCKAASASFAQMKQMLPK